MKRRVTDHAESKPVAVRVKQKAVKQKAESRSYTFCLLPSAFRLLPFAFAFSGWTALTVGINLSGGQSVNSNLVNLVEIRTNECELVLVLEVSSSSLHDDIGRRC